MAAQLLRQHHQVYGVHTLGNYLMLQEVVQPYAQQLTNRIDRGTTVISGPFPG